MGHRFNAFLTPLTLLAGVGAFILSILVTRWMITINIHDTPGHRSSHSQITPRGGGMGIIVGFLLAMSIFFYQGALSHISAWKLFILSTAIIGLSVVSFWDDLKTVPLRHKLIAQIGASFLIVGSGLSFESIPLPWGHVLYLGAFSGILSIFWVIYFTNTMNFMDGLDGLAAGTTLIASFFAILIGLISEQKAFLYVSFSLFGSTLGFFLYNRAPARIFMGDVGSQFLGFLWAVLLLLTTDSDHTPLSFYTIPLLFFSFLYDVGLTILCRLFKRQSIWKPHRTFLFHLLHRSGHSHGSISLIYMFFAIIQGIGALFMQYISPHYQILVFFPYFLMMGGYTLWVRHQTLRVIHRDTPLV